MLSACIACIACGSATREPEFQQSCGGVFDAPPGPIRCDEPTRSRYDGCELDARLMTGECVHGFHFAPGSLCVPDAVDDPAPMQQRSWTDRERAAVRALLEEARDLQERGLPEQSISALERALALAPHPAILARLALYEQELGQIAKPLAAWRQVLASEQAKKELREQASAKIAVLEASIAHLRVVYPPNVESLQVALDRARYEPNTLAAGIAVEPGEHEMVVTAPGRAPWLMHTAIAHGRSLTFTVTLTEIPTRATLAMLDDAGTADTAAK